MKFIFIIFICLLIYLHCADNFRIYKLEKYGGLCLFETGTRGFIVMDLSKFNSGDIVYLTFVRFDGFYGNTLYYDFSNDNSTDIRLNRNVYSYSTSYGYLTGTYTKYYDFYYKIKIPTNEPKLNYLLIGYDLSRTSRLMNVRNTKFARFTSLIISCSFFGIIILAILILFLFKHRIKACYDRANPNQNNFGINNKKAYENALYPSSDNQCNQVHL